MQFERCKHFYIYINCLKINQNNVLLIPKEWLTLVLCMQLQFTKYLSNTLQSGPNRKRKQRFLYLVHRKWALLNLLMVRWKLKDQNANLHTIYNKNKKGQNYRCGYWWYTEQQVFTKIHYMYVNFPKVISFWISDLINGKTISEFLVEWKLQGHKHRQDCV